MRKHLYKDEASKKHDKALAEMSNNPNAPEILKLFYAYAEDDGLLFDLIVLGMTDGYGIQLDKTGLKPGICSLIARYTPNTRHIDLTQENMSEELNLKDIITNLEPHYNAEKNLNAIHAQSNPTEADELLFTGIKIYHEVEGPFSTFAPTLLLDTVPEIKDDGYLTDSWRLNTRSQQLSDKKNNLYFFPTPIIDEDDDLTIHFGDVIDNDILIIPEQKSFFDKSDMPKDAVLLSDADRIYLSMAFREWDEKTVVEKWLSNTLKSEISTYRRNQEIINLLKI